MYAMDIVLNYYYYYLLFLLQASASHVMQIVVIVNEKFRERVPAWDVRLFSVFVTLSHL
jgi:hypothetical protein